MWREERSWQTRSALKALLVWGEDTGFQLPEDILWTYIRVQMHTYVSPKDTHKCSQETHMNPRFRMRAVFLRWPHFWSFPWLRGRQTSTFFSYLQVRAREGFCAYEVGVHHTTFLKSRAVYLLLHLWQQKQRDTHFVEFDLGLVRLLFEVPLGQH